MFLNPGAKACQQRHAVTGWLPTAAKTENAMSLEHSGLLRPVRPYLIFDSTQAKILLRPNGTGSFFKSWERGNMGGSKDCWPYDHYLKNGRYHWGDFVRFQMQK